MTAVFQVALDTHAPVVTWGAVDGAVASETLTVLYAINEPGIASAEIELVDGRVLPMAVAPDRLTVVLPDDAPEGWTEVRAYTRDDVLNEGLATLAVHISGVLGPPPPAPVAPSAPPSFQPIRVETGVSRGDLTSSYTATAVVTSTSRAALRSRYRLPSTRTARLFASGALDSSTGVRARVRGAPAVATTAEKTTVFKRPEGPGAEDDMLVLGIL